MGANMKTYQVVLEGGYQEGDVIELLSLHPTTSNPTWKFEFNGISPDKSPISKITSLTHFRLYSSCFYLCL